MWSKTQNQKSLIDIESFHNVFLRLFDNHFIFNFGFTFLFYKKTKQKACLVTILSFQFKQN